MTPSNKYLKLITQLPRKFASIQSQLRTGHAPLAKHLHCIRKLDSPICPTCQQAEETIQHFMLHCPAHNAAKQTLQNNTGGRNINITKLLTMPKHYAHYSHTSQKQEDGTTHLGKYQHWRKTRVGEPKERQQTMINTHTIHTV